MRHLRITGQMAFADCESGAHSQPHQIDGIRHDRNLVEIIDPPDQAAFAVAPGAKVLDMQIAHGQDRRRTRRFRANLRPQLHPAIEGGAKEWKRALRHPLMFEAQIGVVERYARAQPSLVSLCGFLMSIGSSQALHPIHRASNAKRIWRMRDLPMPLADFGRARIVLVKRIIFSRRESNDI